MTDPWGATRVELERRLRSLLTGQALVLSEPDSEASASPRGFFARRGRRPVPVRYVQFLRLEDALVVECVSDAYWPSMATEQKAELVAAGWHEPNTLREYPTENLVRSFDLEAAPDAAVAAVRALITLGCDPGSRWTWAEIVD
ncbi:hypothetical protein GE115_02595 [Agromyces sp. CFH 90414]|uniref:TY-Chap N-terminal domain-containing protein n=1 Tax=Agromyces agglutinans TaxID=2662258 RepID=A0A6I2F8R7_9MICO|nr:hypothetical protein [Agromyces agglutinans]MRG58766.1 hypothetical protein [Agromyces agglutinans]